MHFNCAALKIRVLLTVQDQGQVQFFIAQLWSYIRSQDNCVENTTESSSIWNSFHAFHDNNLVFFFRLASVPFVWSDVYTNESTAQEPSAFLHRHRSFLCSSQRKLPFQIRLHSYVRWEVDSRMMTFPGVIIYSESDWWIFRVFSVWDWFP